MVESEASPRQRAAIGAVLGLGGIAVAIMGLRGLMLATHRLEAEAMCTTLLGFCLLFFGVTIFLPNVVAFPQRLSQALAVTFMALLFDWVAFVPGPREFHTGSSAAHPGGAVSSITGRVVFGFGALLMDLFALYLWCLAIRLARRNLPQSLP